MKATLITHNDLANISKLIRISHLAKNAKVKSGTLYSCLSKQTILKVEDSSKIIAYLENLCDKLNSFLYNLQRESK